MTHEQYMARALELAASVDLTRDINPRVGAVIVTPDGQVVGEGCHQGSGTDHAEVVALADAGDKARGATIYSTLEPCNATGKRPPCVDALIDAGVSRVVIAQMDPNVTMSGGAKRLQVAGIEVITDVLADQAHELNASWTFAQQNGRPWVIWKTATTLDGFISIKGADSPWITSETSRDMVQAIRASVGAIITGTGTVLADNPHLTVRNHDVEEQPLRVVVGSRPIDPHANVLQGAHPALLMNVEISDVLTALWQQHGVHKVLIEAGQGLSTSVWKQKLVDEVYWFQAPTIAGDGIRVLGDIGVKTLDDIRRFSQNQVHRVGLDVLSHFVVNEVTEKSN